MKKEKLVRITTVPISLEKLLEGQLTYMQEHFEVIAISADKERLKHFGKANGVRTFAVNLTRQITPIADIKAVAKLYNFLKREQPKIVHTHTPKAGIVGMLAAKMAGVPIRMHTVAGMPLMESSKTKRKILYNVEKQTYNFATALYPNSTGLYDFIVKNKLAKPEKLKIIGQGSSNGIDTDYFDPRSYTSGNNEKFRKSIGVSSKDTLFIFVGRLVGDKGINELLSAFKILCKNYSSKNPKLLLVGTFEAELDRLQPETINEIDHNPDVIAVGFQNDVRPYLAISDALVFPSYREGFPNVVMQAGAMGLPSIVTDINGCNEIIEEGTNGLIIPKKDQDALKNAMIKLLEHQEFREKLASKARPLIVQRYQRKKIWEELLKEYRQQLS